MLYKSMNVKILRRNGRTSQLSAGRQTEADEERLGVESRWIVICLPPTQFNLVVRETGSHYGAGDQGGALIVHLKYGRVSGRRTREEEESDGNPLY